MKGINNSKKIKLLLVLLGISLLVFAFFPTLGRYKHRTSYYELTEWDGSVASGYRSGSGTEIDPYIISNGSEFAYFRSQLNHTDYNVVYFELGSDIVLNKGLFDYDGTISYSDISRHYCINIENPSDIYYTKTPIDELFPITLPYYPTVEKYKFYTQTFLTDKRNGDYDTKAFLYVITPEGEKVEVNKFYAEINKEWKEISEEEYNERLNKRIDKLHLKVADHLLFTILDNSSTEQVSKQRNEAFNNLSKLEQEEIENELQQACLIFENSEYWQYNTFSVLQNLCTQREAGEYPESIENIRIIINKILDKIENIK